MSCRQYSYVYAEAGVDVGTKASAETAAIGAALNIGHSMVGLNRATVWSSGETFNA